MNKNKEEEKTTLKSTIARFVFIFQLINTAESSLLLLLHLDLSGEMNERMKRNHSIFRKMGI